MTLAQQLKQRNDRNRAELLKILDINDDDLAMLIFESAYKYLENVFGTDAYGLKHLPNTSEFWAWWKMEFAKIDSIFLAAIDHELSEEDSHLLCKVRDRDNTRGKQRIKSREELYDCYLHYHEASMQNRYINSDIMYAGAHAMIKAIKNRENATPQMQNV